MIWIAIVILAVLAGFIAMNWVPEKPLSSLVDRWARPPSDVIDVNGLGVHLRDVGPRDDAMPVILIHGTSSCLHTWDGWARVLSPHKRVITFDLPGFGLTGPSPAEDCTIGAYVAFMGAFLDRLDIKTCILGGNSLGGDIAWQTADAMPGRVHRLILVDAGGYDLAPEAIPIGFRIARTPILNRIVRSVLPRRLVAASVRNVYGDPSKVSAETVDLYFDMAARQGNRRALSQRFQQLDFGINADRIPLLKLPTLILWGGRDRLIPPSHGDRFHREITGSEYVVFPALGHVPHEEDPETTIAPVLAFLHEVKEPGLTA